MSTNKLDESDSKPQILNQIYANADNSNQHRQFQPEELMYILETYVNNLDSFRRSGNLNGKDALRPRKDIIREIADTCTYMGHSVRTEKQIEQKLRDELKKLRKFNNEVKAQNLKSGCVYPRASRGTIFLYNKLILNQPENQTKTTFENLEAILNSLNQNNLKDRTPPLMSSNDEAIDLIKSTSMMEALQNLVKPKEEEEEQEEEEKPIKTESVQPSPINHSRKRARTEEMEPPRSESSKHDEYQEMSLDQKWQKERIKTEMAKQKYYQLKSDNQLLLNKYMRKKLEMLTNGKDAQDLPGFTQNMDCIPSPMAADDLETDGDSE